MITTPRGTEMFINGQLVDTVSFTPSGAVMNVLPNGKTIETPFSNVPLRSGLTAGGCGGGSGSSLHGINGQIAIDKLNVANAQHAYDWALFALLASGLGITALDIATMGAATVALLGEAGVGVAYLNARDALRAANDQLHEDENNAILQGCHD